jgi:hypothetical protein
MSRRAKKQLAVGLQDLNIDIQKNKQRCNQSVGFDRCPFRNTKSLKERTCHGKTFCLPMRSDAAVTSIIIPIGLWPK